MVEGVNQAVTFAIIARNEEGRIGATIQSLFEQAIFESPVCPAVLVYANACTDDTIAEAENALQHFGGRAEKSVHISDIGGKSRGWNQVVHGANPYKTEVLFFLDADIRFAHREVCTEMMRELVAEPRAIACTGRPVKSVALKQKKSLFEQVSLKISSDSRADRVLNGSLYCIYDWAAKGIWLPDETAGEDGFLNAMIRTKGFSAADNPDLIAQAPSTTHYYDGAGLTGTFRHERRMIVATMMNVWMMEHFWGQDRRESIAPEIKGLNERDPAWVADLIRSHAEKKYWLIRKSLVLQRMPSLASGWRRAISKLPLGLAATAFTFLVAVSANRVLRRAGASTHW